MAEKIEVLGYQRTLVGTYIQNVKFCGLPYEMHEHTTLNEVFGVQAGVAPEKTEYPMLRYLVIGNQGHKVVTGPDDSPTFADRGWFCTHTRLYGHLPFIMREVSNDLTPAEREKYCLRIVKAYNGINYAMYYGRRIDLGNARVVYKTMTQKDGQEDTNSFAYTAANADPKPPRYDTNGTIIGTKQSVFTSATVTVTLSAEEVSEIINGYRIIYDTTLAPILSEMGLCSGVDRTIPLTGTNTFYTEVIACQINCFIGAGNSLRHDNDGLRFEFDLGSSEPMLAVKEQ